MKCSRCGYFNAQTASSCVKCNTPLTANASLSEEVGGRKTQELPNQSEVNEFLKKTIVDKSGDLDGFSASKTVADFSASKTITDFGSTESNTNQQTFQESIQENTASKVTIIPCPVCNYPVSGDAKFCPGCNHELSRPVSNQPIPQKQTSSKMKERAPQKTINFFAMDDKSEEKKVTLTEIKQNGEKDIELLSEGKTICLNKESLQQEKNPAISENSHAEMINFEGDWYLVNRTSAGTTFVAANKPHKLEKDDIILVGNTIYRFNG